MKNNAKKIISFFLAVMMIASIISAGTISASAAYENTHKNTGNQRADIVAVAQTQLGYQEGSNNNNKYGAAFGNNYAPWCAYFISWCAKEAGISDSIIHRQGVASPFSGYFNVPNTHSSGSYFPQPGDLVFYGPNSNGDHYHVGLVETVNSSTGMITTIEGNTNGNGSSEGYIVYRHTRHYQNKNICCYGIPKYTSTTSHKVDTNYGKNFTAYPKAKITASNIFDANHIQTSSTAWIGTTDKCTINEVYTDGCCKVTYPLDGGGTKTAYSKISLFNTTHTHSYSTYVYYEAAHPHYKCYKCSCGEVQRRTSETYLVTSCAKCSEIAKYTLSASPSSLTMRVGETKSITFTESSSGFTVYMNGRYSSSYLSIVEFGGWVDSCKRTITFKAIKEGNAEITIDLCASLTDKVMKTVTVPITVLPDSFTVSYNANGGTGAPSPQIKYYNKTLTLSDVEPYRTGYDFAGWDNQNPPSRAYYSSGANYTNNAAITLYAYWKPHRYEVRYNANGGTGTMSNSSHTYDTAKALTANTFTRTGYTFLGWSTSASATTATYTDKQSVKNLTASNGGTVTLYAVWKQNPVTVSSISIVSLPSKTTYTVGETFSLNGISIKVNMSDGTSKTVTNGFTVSSPDMSTAGTKTVTVTYEGKTETFNITVKAVAVKPNPTDYDAVVTVEAPSKVAVGKEFTMNVYLEGSYDGYSFEIPKYTGFTYKSAKASNSSVKVDEKSDRLVVSVMPGLELKNSPKTLIVSVTYTVNQNAVAGNTTLSVENAKITNEFGDKITAVYIDEMNVEIVQRIPGDINGDDVFDYTDVAKLYAYFRGNSTIDEDIDVDFNNDGTFDYTDVAKLYAIFRGNSTF